MPQPANPDTLTIDYAAFRKRYRRLKRNWWARPMIWMDHDEPGTVNRDLSEGLACTNILQQARYRFRRDPSIRLEDRLDETRIARDYALAHGVGVVRFLMYILMMSDRHCRRMLVLTGTPLDAVKIDHQFHSMSKVSKYDERALKRYVAGLKKPCPGRSFNRKDCDQFVTADHGICWHCLQRYGATRAEWPSWLVMLVRDDDKEYRRRAKEALYFQEVHEGLTLRS